MYTNDNSINNIDNNAGNIANLPMRAMREIPQPGANAMRITGLVKERGRVSGYQLSDGQILDKPAAINLARGGGIQGVGISSRKGSEYLKSLPDDSGTNNLNALPTISADS
ncbi:MAG: DUF3892 domain-containing protein [Oscillospiraceae bacterium]|jgi:hypothetical protein|nr:DUF3892 domain-containing protein [Oscillospiraceae bacterium]